MKVGEMLTVKQRLGLSLTKGLSASQAVEADVSFEFLKANKVPVTVLRACRIDAVQLKAIGAHEARHLAEIGFNALHLVDRAFCESTVAAYGASDVKDVFLNTANDAVALAGSHSVELLDVSADELLEACCAEPGCAHAVLQQMGSLKGVLPKTLLDTGMRRASLVALGYTASRLVSEIQCDGSDLQVLGFC